MKHTLTLSRWHKVAERMQLAIKERETAVKSAYTATAISPWNKAAGNTPRRCSCCRERSTP